MKNKKIIGIGLLTSVLLVIGIANAEFFGNFMRTPEQILQRATTTADKAKEAYIETLKEKAEALKDVAIDKGEKLQKKDFVSLTAEDTAEIERLRVVIKDTNLAIESFNLGAICGDSSFQKGL